MYLTEQINKIIFMRVYYGVFNNCSVHSIEGLIYTFIHRSVWIHLRVSFPKRNSDFGRFFLVIISVQNFWIKLSLKKKKKKNWIHFLWKNTWCLDRHSLHFYRIWWFCFIIIQRFGLFTFSFSPKIQRKSQAQSQLLPHRNPYNYGSKSNNFQRTVYRDHSSHLFLKYINSFPNAPYLSNNNNNNKNDFTFYKQRLQKQWSR